ncbi:hypothetical protein [Streptomyces rimosus]|uniref:hypothetical protein n=1 Tax=Streptomyces rimosus TaxID=1927 RepID=UPI00067BF9D2|nr:hypothetical protein [Streptomyces rimosus]
MGYDWAPTTGTYAVDTTSDKIGEVRRLLEGAAYLAPPGGGREWAVRPDQLRKPTVEERARALTWTRPVAGRARSTPHRGSPEPPVNLPMRAPSLEPVPVDGCEVCAHAVVWRRAYRTGKGTADGYTNHSAALDCSLEIRNHPHEPRVMGLPIDAPAVRP